MTEFVIRVSVKNEDDVSSLLNDINKYDCKYNIEKDDSKDKYNFMYKELPYGKLGEKYGRTKEEYQKDLKYYDAVSKLLESYGMDSNYKGFKYSVECIRLINAYGIESYTMDFDVYPLVSKWYNVTPQSIEHNIRNAINNSWRDYESGKRPDSLISIFNRKPTNIKFLKHIAKTTNSFILGV